jgi:hypothetical protein
MNLNWQPGKDWDERVTSAKEWPITEALIFATMRIGMPTITAENAETFTVRLYAFTRVYGPLLMQATDRGIEPVPIRLADVQLRIGLRTNATRMTDAAFRHHLTRDIMLDARAQLVRESVTPAEAAEGGA